MSKAPQLVVLAGPNGAGKSTAAPAILPGVLNIQEFVNADEIAKGLSGFSPEGAALAAGKIMLERLHELARLRRNFAFETTLASRSYAARIREWRSSGYGCQLCFFRLPSAEMAIERVRRRVAAGGHDIERETIIRRYSAGLRNFFGLYRSIADHWRMYDSSDGKSPRLIAEGRTDAELNVVDHEVWAALLGEYGNA
jgi:predicted ABC-type ATPase